jgi:hypothetical protein
MGSKKNDIYNQKMAQSGPLTRADIADVLLSIGAPGEKRDQKKAAIKQLTEDKPGNHSDGFGGHKIYEALDDFPQW